MEKNTAGKWVVFAYQGEGGANPGQPVTGDAANITANIRIDGGAANPVDDTNPTELEDGYYVFDVTAAEANGDNLLIAPASTTANVSVIGVPGAVYTTPANFNDLAITATTGNTTVGTNNDKTGYSISGTKTTLDALNDVAATDIVSAGAINTLSGSVSTVTTVTNGVTVTTNSDKTGYTISGTKTTLDALNDLSAAQVNAEVDTAISDAALATAADLAVVDTNVDSILVDTDTTIPALIDALPTAAENADAVWDEPLTAATHNIATSAGKRLRQVASNITRNELAQGSGTGTNQIQLDTGASAVDDTYDPSIISIIAGTGSGQARMITQYDGATKTATVKDDWKILPDATSEFVIVADPGYMSVNHGLAVAATSTTITLNALSSSADNAYVGQTVFITSGTGADQARTVSAYNGTTKIATVIAWDTIPNTTSSYFMLPQSLSDNDAIAQAVLSTQMTESYAADGVSPTLAQALLMIQQNIGDFSISGTTITVKKLDGSTTAATYTLDDGTSPTSRTRAT